MQCQWKCKNGKRCFPAMFTGSILLKLNEPKRVLKSLMDPDSPLGQFTYELQNVVLFQRFFDLDEQTQISLERKIATQPWTIPHILNRTLKLIVPAQTCVFQNENIFNSQTLPLECLICMRELSVSQGNFQTDLFEFESFGLQEISITVNDFVFPGIKMNFQDKDDTKSFGFFDAYKELIYDKDNIWHNESSFLSYQRYVDQKSFIIRIDMSNGNFRNMETALQPTRIGQGRLKMVFDPAGTITRPNLEILIFTKEYATISFNALRQISRDYPL